jgi:hypothetical protein
MLKLVKLKKDQNGSGLLLCILILFFMLGAAGLVVDASVLYKAKGEMRKAANAAALSGAQMVLNGNDYINKKESVSKAACDILKVNDEYDIGTQLSSSPIIDLDDDENKVTVTLKKDVSLYFMKIFGVVAPVPIEVSSSAMIGPLGAASGGAPIGIRDDMDLQIGNAYPLKLQPGDGDSGNYNLLALGGNGGDILRDNFKYGYKSEIKIGQTVVITKPGSTTGPTQQGLQYRLDDTSNPNSTILMVIIYDHNDILQGKSEVTVMGFAFFDIKDMRTSGNDGKNISGVFIKKITTGSINDGAVDKSAYAIKLVE